MVQFSIGLTEINPIENKIKVFLEKDPHKEPYIHRACLTIDANEALKLIDELKNAVVKLSNSK